MSGVVGGATAAPGALISAVTNNVIPNLNNVDAWLAILSGVGVVQLLRQSPDGLASLWASNARRLTKRFERRSTLPAPSTQAVTESAPAPDEPLRGGRRSTFVAFPSISGVSSQWTTSPSGLTRER